MGSLGSSSSSLGVHAGLSHFLSWQRETFGFRAEDRFAQLTGLSFDVLMRSVFSPLCSGATLCLPESLEDLTAGTVLPWLAEQRVTALHAVPALA